MSPNKGSPRLRAFDGNSWVTSPRTGYTYVDTATYRDKWTPEREVPMPHMARPPLGQYRGHGARSRLDFSDEEESINTYQYSYSSAKTKNTSIFSGIMWLLRLILYQIPAMITKADTYLLVREESESKSSSLVASAISSLTVLMSSFFQKIISISRTLVKATSKLLSPAPKRTLTVNETPEEDIVEYIKKVTYRYINIWNLNKPTEVEEEEIAPVLMGAALAEPETKVKSKAKSGLGQFLPLAKSKKKTKSRLLPILLLLLIPFLLAYFGPDELQPHLAKAKNAALFIPRTAFQIISSISMAGINLASNILSGIPSVFTTFWTLTSGFGNWLSSVANWSWTQLKSPLHFLANLPQLCLNGVVYLSTTLWNFSSGILSFVTSVPSKLWTGLEHSMPTLMYPAKIIFSSIGQLGTFVWDTFAWSGNFLIDLVTVTMPKFATNAVKIPLSILGDFGNFSTELLTVGLPKLLSSAVKIPFSFLRDVGKFGLELLSVTLPAFVTSAMKFPLDLVATIWNLTIMPLLAGIFSILGNIGNFVIDLLTINLPEFAANALKIPLNFATTIWDVVSYLGGSIFSVLGQFGNFIIDLITISVPEFLQFVINVPLNLGAWIWKNVLTNGWDHLGNLGNWCIDLITVSLPKMIGDGMKIPLQILVATISFPMSVLTSLWDILAHLGNWSFEAITVSIPKIFGNAITIPIDVMTDLWNWTGNVVTSIWDMIAGFGNWSFETITVSIPKIFGNAISFPIDVMVSLWNLTGNVATSIWDMMAGFVNWSLDWLTVTMPNMFGSALNLPIEIIAGLWDISKSIAFAIASIPMMVLDPAWHILAELGNFVMELPNLFVSLMAIPFSMVLGLWNLITDGFSVLSEAILSAGSLGQDFAISALNATSEATGSVFAMALNIFDLPATIFMGLWDIASGTLTMTWNSLQDIGSGSLEMVGAFFNWTQSSISSIFFTLANLPSWIYQQLPSLSFSMDFLWNSLVNLMSSITESLLSMFGLIGDTFKWTGTELYEILTSGTNFLIATLTYPIYYLSGPRINVNKILPLRPKEQQIFSYPKDSTEDYINKVYQSVPFQKAVQSAVGNEINVLRTEIDNLIENAKNDLDLQKFKDPEFDIQSLLDEKFNNLDKLLLQATALNDEKFEQMKNDFDAKLAALKVNSGDPVLDSTLGDLKIKLEQLEAEIELNQMQVKNCCNKTVLTLDMISKFLMDNKDVIDSHLDTNGKRDELLASLATELKQSLIPVLMPQVRELASKVALEKMTLETNEKSRNLEMEFNKDLEQLVQGMIRTSLLQYDADKTGRFDFALETAGASVVNTRCTETYTRRTAAYTLFGIPLWYPFNNPRTVIQPGVQPGECWAFKGTQGFVVIQLSRKMVPNAFSLEHIPKALSPDGKIASAPKNFEVLGLNEQNDPQPFSLGNFTYEFDGDPVQYFDGGNPGNLEFSHVELVIKSNHGNPNFTCLYRFRVHGAP